MRLVFTPVMNCSWLFFASILWLRSNQPKRSGVQSARFKQFALLMTVLKDSQINCIMQLSHNTCIIALCRQTVQDVCASTHPARSDLGLNVQAFAVSELIPTFGGRPVVRRDLFCELDPFVHRRPSLWIGITPSWDTLMMTRVLQSSLFRLIPTADSASERITNECY